MEEAAELPRLKELLGERKDRGAKVELLVPIPTGIVKIALPGAYSVATAELMGIQAMPGMVAEAA